MSADRRIAFSAIGMLALLALVGGLWYAVVLAGIGSESRSGPATRSNTEYSHQLATYAKQAHHPVYWLGPTYDDLGPVEYTPGLLLLVGQTVPVDDNPSTGSVQVNVLTVLGQRPSWIASLHVIETRSVGNGELVVASAPGNTTITPDLKRTVHAKLQVYKPA